MRAWAFQGYARIAWNSINQEQFTCRLAPGFIATEMTDALKKDVVEKWVENIPLKRAGSPDDVANSCLFLASDMSTYVTGQKFSAVGP